MAQQLKMPRIFFTGVGGQGTLTATRLLAQAALEAGIMAASGEVHGMAQRGGVVESTLLLGGWRSSRLDFGEADILLGFEPLESLRALPYLKKEGGYVFSGTDFFLPSAVTLGQSECPDLQTVKKMVGEQAAKSWFVPCGRLGREAGSLKAGNTVLLGVVCASGLLPFGAKALEKAIKTLLPAKIVDINLAAMKLGSEWLKSAPTE